MTQIYIFSIIVKSKHHHSFICSYFYKNQSTPNNPSLVSLPKAYFFQAVFRFYQNSRNGKFTSYLAAVPTGCYTNITKYLWFSFCFYLSSFKFSLLFLTTHLFLHCFRDIYGSNWTAIKYKHKIKLSNNSTLITYGKSFQDKLKLGINQNLRRNRYYHSFQNIRPSSSYADTSILS